MVGMSKFLADWRRFIVSNNLLRQDHTPAEERLAANLLYSLLLTVGLILVFFITPRHFINPTPDVTTRALLSLVGGSIALVAGYV
jgi:hypothetical protein